MNCTIIPQNLEEPTMNRQEDMVVRLKSTTSLCQEGNKPEIRVKKGVHSCQDNI